MIHSVKSVMIRKQRRTGWTGRNEEWKGNVIERKLTKTRTTKN